MSLSLNPNAHTSNPLFIPGLPDNSTGPLEAAQRLQWVRRAEKRRQGRQLDTNPEEYLDHERKQRQLSGLNATEEIGLENEVQLAPGPALKALSLISEDLFGLTKKSNFPKALGFKLTPQKQASTLTRYFSLMIEPVM